jgi:hypothetical protein
MSVGIHTREENWVLTWIRKRIVFLSLVGALLLTLVGSIVYANIPDPNGVIHGCYTNQTFDGVHAIGVLDTAKNPTCPKNTTAISWNQQGPKGDPGPATTEPSTSGQALSQQKIFCAAGWQTILSTDPVLSSSPKKFQFAGLVNANAHVEIRLSINGNPVFDPNDINQALVQPPGIGEARTWVTIPVNWWAAIPAGMYTFSLEANCINPTSFESALINARSLTAVAFG